MLNAFILLHTLISLIGIATGFVVMYGLLTSQTMPKMTAAFLVTTILTSVTGFPIPADKFLPSHAVGILSLIILAICVLARYRKEMVDIWRPIYLATAIAAQFFNCFVAVVQAFKHVPFLHPLAPTQSEPPFAVTEGVLLLGMIAVGVVALKRFRPESVSVGFA